MMEHARILVIGAGVNGSVIAAGLHDGGVDVTLLARGSRYETIRAEGIVIENPFNGKRTVTRLPVTNRLDAADCYDFVLVVVRKSQVAALLPVLAQNLSPNVVFMGNNLSGPGELVAALGKERVMMGSVYAAGRREGDLIRALVFKYAGSPFGEVDGQITPRLRQLAAIFRQAGFRFKMSRTMVDFAATHAAGVALIGSLIMQHNCDASALARSTSDLRLYVQAQHEAHQVLRAVGFRIVPWTEVVTGSLPDFVQVAAMGWLLKSRMGTVGLAWHVSQAGDEICQLAAELRTLVDKAGIPAPAIRQILAQGNDHWQGDQ